MQRMRSVTGSIIGAMVFATLCGVLAMVASAWGVWALSTLRPSVGAAIVPFLVGLAVQVLLFNIITRGNRTSWSTILVSGLVGLVVLVVVGGALSEIVHCRYDRFGCINL